MSSAQEAALVQELFAIQELGPTSNRLYSARNAAQQESLFLSGAIRNPRHHYDELEQLDLGPKISAIDDFKQNLGRLSFSGFSQTEEILQAYAEGLDAEIALHSAAKTLAFQSTGSDPTPEQSAQFRSWTSEVHGELDVVQYDRMLYLLETRFQDLGDDAAISIRDGLLERLPKSSRQQLPYVPDQDTKAKVTSFTETLFGSLRPTLTIDGSKPTADRAVAALKTVLHQELDAPHWDADEADIRAPASTNRMTDRIHVKHGYLFPTNAHADDTALHESFHALRAIEAQRIGSLLLLLGLPGAHDAEEGLATVFGNVYAGLSSDKPRFDYPTLITGLMEQDDYDFRDCHEVLWRVFVLYRHIGLKTPISDEVIVTVKRQAYSALRAETPAFNLPRHRSLSYAPGVEKAWKYLAAHHDDYDSMQTLLIGKHDPTNPDHVRFVLNA